LTVTYVTIADVQAHLNAQGPDTNGNYTVYALAISANAFQSHVDHANTYINAIVGVDLDPSDPRYNVAELAALDLACLRVLVVSVGGSMVGAFDYFLGDLRVSRSGPYTFAIKQAIQGFSMDLQKQIVNLAPAATSAEADLAERVPRYRGELIKP
jgi:hypothetical protein